ncbi:MAG: trypsin-like serine protease [Deltaproteobacteria bacterium]|nr:MAG: trypsin-like serine protease [Deltaproteobacteria bacterium]
MRHRSKSLTLGLLCLLLGVGMVACQYQEAPTQAPTLNTVKQKVVGGQPDNRLPAVGALLANKRSFCTGTLIASRLVVTAAHCITSAQQSRQSGQTVEFRIDLPTGQGNNFQSVFYEADLLETHPQYRTSGGGLLNDVAYMTLKKDVTGVSPIPIHTTKMDNSWVGRKILFLGYGLIQTQPQLRSPGRKYGAEITLRTVQGDRIETKDTGISICSGDSGGPGLYKIGNDYQIVAVNSYVTGRTSGRQPLCDGSGWSFRVDYYVSWLTPLINKYGGKCTADKDCGPCYRCDTQQGKCVIKGTTPTKEFCSPCSAPSQCGGNGQNICQRQSVGNRCLQECDLNGCCPLGTSCRSVGGVSQCVPDKGACEPYKCQSDSECGPGEECNSGECKPKPVQASATLCKKCSSNADCGAGVCTDYPDGKYCTMPCVAENFCPTGYACKVVGGKAQCISSSGECKCSADTDCHTGNVCNAGICGKQGGGKYGDACDKSRPCAKNYSCVESQSGNDVCVQACEGGFKTGQPGAACNTDGQCASGSRCYGIRGVGYACLQTCSRDGDCRNGGKCTQYGSVSICICQTDGECTNGTACNKDILSTYGQCAAKATGGVPCEKGYECSFTGYGNYCLPEPTQEPGEACSGTSRCKDGSFCAQTGSGSYVCIKTCQSNSDCSKEGGTCTRSSGFSFCNCNSSSCSPGYVCKAISSNNKVCTVGTCKTDADCGNTAVCDNGKCKPKEGSCRSDSDCESGKYCVSGLCSDCRSAGDCGANETCNQGKCQTRPGACNTNADCAQGQVCENGTCKAPSACVQDADCAQSYVCREAKCVPAGSCSENKDCKSGQICEFGVCVKDPTPPKPEVTPDAGPANNNNNTNSNNNTTTPDLGTPISQPACGCTATPSSLPSQSLFWFFLVLCPLLVLRRRKQTQSF